MIQGRSGLSLALEPFNGLAVSGELGRQELQGDETVELRPCRRHPCRRSPASPQSCNAKPSGRSRACNPRDAALRSEAEDRPDARPATTHGYYTRPPLRRANAVERVLALEQSRLARPRESDAE